MNFNLIDQPWIPVRMKDRAFALVSLDGAFAGGEMIADLDARPHERISLMRLLVCVAQASGGIPDGDWDNFRSRFASDARSYLGRDDVRPYFDLFGEGPRFLQRGISTGEPVPSSKLFPVLASGNNPTAFDHEGGTARAFPPARLALGVLTFQNFYPLYGAGYKGRGPCVDSNMLHTFVRGASLRDIIANNCLDAAELSAFSGGVGRPIWESFPADSSNTEAVANATATYLGRLVPMHRSLRLTDDGSHFHLSKEALEYPPYDIYAKEPSATVVVWGKAGQEKPRLLPARLDQAVWRQLHALTIPRGGGSGKASAPPVLECFHQNNSESCAIWTGALVTDLKAKIIDAVESTFSLPGAMFGVGRATYQSGVDFAEFWSRRLRDAVTSFGKALKMDKPSTTAATRHFWNALDQQSAVLLEIVRHPELLDGPEATFGPGSGDPWTNLVVRSANEAYKVACPRQTARHYEAFAAGLRKLYPNPSKKKQPAQP